MAQKQNLARTEPTQTRERLLNAATLEFCDHGYAGANIARISQAADCNVRMIYHYFDNKDGLYAACLARVYAHLRESEEKLHFWLSPPAEGIAQLTRFTFDYMLENPQFPRMVINENLNDGRFVREVDAVNAGSKRFLDHIDSLLIRGVEQGVFARRADPLHLYLTILASSFIHISNQHTLMKTFGFDARAPEFLAERREHAVDVVLSYLRQKER